MYQRNSENMALCLCLLIASVTFMLLGVSMEALCSRTSAQPDDTIILCLKAVDTLLCTEREATVSPAVSREILAILHRLLLTRDNAVIRVLSVAVLSQLVKAARHNTDCKYKRTRRAL